MVLISFLLRYIFKLISTSKHCNKAIFMHTVKMSIQLKNIIVTFQVVISSLIKLLQQKLNQKLFIVFSGFSGGLMECNNQCQAEWNI